MLLNKVVVCSQRRIVHITHSVPQGKPVNIPVPITESVVYVVCRRDSGGMRVGFFAGAQALAGGLRVSYLGRAGRQQRINDGNIKKLKATFGMLIVTLGRDLFSS
jgi:hypothetical protein